MRKVLLLLCGMVMLTTSLVGGAGTAQAAATLPSATYLYLDSDTGDAIGGGQTNIAFLSPKGMHIQGGRNGFRMWITLEQGDHEILLAMENLSGKPIRPGVHHFAGYPEGPYEFSINGWGEGCGSSDGTLNIRQLEFDRDDKISRLDVSFVTSCTFYGSGSARGHLAYRSTKKLVAPSSESVLRTGQTLRSGHSLTNISGIDGGQDYDDQAPRLVVRGGQALLIHRVWPSYYSRDYTDTVVWATPTAGSDADRIAVRADGSLALRNKAGKTVWSTRPKGARKGDFLLVNNTGQLVLANPRYKQLWSVG